MSTRNVKLAWLVAASVTSMFPSLASAQSSSVVDDSGIVFSHRIFADSPGWQSCRHWLEVRSNHSDQARAMEAWALGYATGYSLNRNRDRNNHYTITNDLLFSAIDDECRKPEITAVPIAVDRILGADGKAEQN